MDCAFGSSFFGTWTSATYTHLFTYTHTRNSQNAIRFERLERVDDVWKCAVFFGVIYFPCSSTTCRSPSLKLLLFFFLVFFSLSFLFSVMRWDACMQPGSGTFGFASDTCTQLTRRKFFFFNPKLKKFHFRHILLPRCTALKFEDDHDGRCQKCSKFRTFISKFSPHIPLLSSGQFYHSKSTNKKYNSSLHK